MAQCGSARLIFRIVSSPPRPRHRDVQQHDVGLQGDRELHALVHARRLPQDVEVCALQQRHQPIANQLLIVYKYSNHSDLVSAVLASSVCARVTRVATLDAHTMTAAGRCVKCHPANQVARTSNHPHGVPAGKAGPRRRHGGPQPAWPSVMGGRPSGGTELAAWHLSRTTRQCNAGAESPAACPRRP